ncbi:MAG: asparaginase [Clostridia bacterium]|nr:asparaginase [Clostridia bacterium]
MSEVIIEVTRGSLVENIIRGHVAVIGPDRNLAAHVGNADYLTYMRSTAKPLQASAAIESGAIDFFAISEDELAIMCGSHIGASYHVAALESILVKIGLQESDFTLGEDYSLSMDLRQQRVAEQQPPRKLYNNCSGKHACMLTLCRYVGWDYRAYQLPEHPVQQLIKATVAGYAEVAPESIIVGVDGCGVPVFALPLSSMARAYANLAHAERLPEPRQAAARRLTAAMTAHPQMVAGWGQFCTELMRVTKGRIIGKLGADGAYCAAELSGDLAFALKIEDGNTAMLPLAVMRVLNELDILTQAENTALAAFSRFDNLNCQKDKVGEAKAVFHLTRGTYE